MLTDHCWDKEIKIEKNISMRVWWFFSTLKYFSLFRRSLLYFLDIGWKIILTNQTIKNIRAATKFFVEHIFLTKSFEMLLIAVVNITVYDKLFWEDLNKIERRDRKNIKRWRHSLGICHIKIH